MIKFVIGAKGSGKTGRLVDELNRLAMDEQLNIVCLEKGDRLDRQVKPQIRLVDVSQYPVNGYRELLSFIAGIAAKDFDITDLYIDSINKVTGSDCREELAQFVKELEQFIQGHAMKVTILLSISPEEMPESLKPYIS